MLIVNREQYGYHIDTYKYCEYLKPSISITYIGWERFGLPKIKSEGLTVKYISRKGNKLIRYYRFLKEINKEIKQNYYDLVFLVFFPFVSIIKFLNSNNIYNVDIRSCSTGRNKIMNLLNDRMMTLECSTFKSITVISRSLAEALKIKHYHLLPLGGENFSSNIKSFEKIKLLYVGTLQGRNIIECVKGLHEFIKTNYNTDPLDISFTIIGDSTGNEKEEICEYINQHKLSKYIKVEGYIHNSLLYRFFEDANIGVSYIPIIDCFKNQPPTKTYEYLLSGLPVIATKTKENVNIVSEGCGVLIDDKIETFVSGLNKVVEMRSTFNSEKIKSFYEENLWKNIVLNNLKPFILSLIDKRNK